MRLRKAKEGRQESGELPQQDKDGPVNRMIDNSDKRRAEYLVELRKRDISSRDYESDAHTAEHLEERRKETEAGKIRNRMFGELRVFANKPLGRERGQFKDMTSLLMLAR